MQCLTQLRTRTFGRGGCQWEQLPMWQMDSFRTSRCITCVCPSRVAYPGSKESYCELNRFFCGAAAGQVNELSAARQGIANMNSADVLGGARLAACARLPSDRWARGSTLIRG